MRFIHMADVHLGMQPDLKRDWSKERSNEIWRTFQNVVNRCEEESIDLLLIAGDLFHRQPLLRELKEINYMFQKLTRTKVVLMAGNHDYISHTSNYNQFTWAKNVFMFIHDELESIYIEELNTRIFGLSYLMRDITEPKYHKEVMLNRNEITILLAHGGDEKDIPFDKKVVESLGYTYVALGHIHKPAILSNQMAYPGSLEPLDKTETGEHGYIAGEILGEETGYQTILRFVPCSQRQYHVVTIDVHPQMTVMELKDLICDKLEQIGKQHIFTIILQGHRDVDITFDEEELMTLGNIVDLTDQTIPDYNFDELYLENKDNIIGMYIDKIRNMQYEEEVINKALYLGVRALLKQKS